MTAEGTRLLLAMLAEATAATIFLDTVVSYG